jgi:hypothetical protein
MHSGQPHPNVTLTRHVEALAVTRAQTSLMRRRNMLRATLALVLVIGVVTMGTPTAMAAPTGRYRTQPAGTAARLVDLGLSVTVEAGATRLVSSHLVVGGAGELTAVSHLVYCRPLGSSTVTERIVSGQNVIRATKVVLLTRALVSAPATRALSCRLYGIFINHTSTRVWGTISVLAGTDLQRLTAPIRSSAQAWQNGQALVNSEYRAAPVRFTPAAGARSIQAFGDVNITVCYYSSGGTCLGAGARRSGSHAYVGTQFVVRQLQANGAICRSYYSGPLVGTNISSTIHHFKINKSIINIPVTASCTSRTFIAYVRVTANRGANSILVEPIHQSETALYVRP